MSPPARPYWTPNGDKMGGPGIYCWRHCLPCLEATGCPFCLAEESPMTTDQCLREAAALPLENRIEYLEGMLRGQAVDPIWPDEDMQRVKAAWLTALKERSNRRK